MYTTLITESYWKQNYKNFRQKNPYLANYLKEDFKRNGYNSKLLLETIMLNESYNLSEYNKIMNNIKKHVDEGNMEGIKTNVKKLDKLVPNSIKNQTVPKDRVKDIYNTIENVEIDKLHASKEAKSFMGKLDESFKYIIDYIGIDVVTVLVITWLLYMLIIYLSKNEYEIHSFNARTAINILGTAIIAGSIYVIIKSFVKASLVSKRMLEHLQVDYKNI